MRASARPHVQSRRRRNRRQTARAVRRESPRATTRGAACGRQSRERAGLRWKSAARAVRLTMAVGREVLIRLAWRTAQFVIEPQPRARRQLIGDFRVRVAILPCDRAELERQPLLRRGCASRGRPRSGRRRRRRVCWGSRRNAPLAAVDGRKRRGLCVVCCWFNSRGCDEPVARRPGGCDESLAR